MVACNKFTSCLVWCLAGVLVLIAAGCEKKPEQQPHDTPKHDDDHYRAESCPEFLTTPRLIINSSNPLVSARTIDLQLLFVACNATNGDPIELAWDVQKISGPDPVEQVFVDGSIAQNPRVVGTGHDSWINTAAIIKEGLKNSYIVTAKTRVLHDNAYTTRRTRPITILPNGVLDDFIPVTHTPNATEQSSTQQNATGQWKAESCPEFAVVNPNYIFAGDAKHNSLQIKLSFPKGSHFDDVVALRYTVKKLDGTPVPNLANVFDHFDVGPLSILDAGKSTVSFYPVARVKSNVTDILVVRIDVDVTTTEGTACTGLTSGIVVLPGTGFGSGSP